jgi:tetraacyldisaccharide 4'-kinase
LRPRPGLGRPVIAVGNLEVGGTGKTPFVRWLVSYLKTSGELPLVVTRPYGSVSAAGHHDEEASLAADGIWVESGRNRTRAAERGLANHPEATVVIFDDAAQALQDPRDWDLFLVDARRPFGSGWPLPAGSLREFRRGLRRAHMVLISRSDGLTEGEWDQTLKLLGRFSDAPMIPLRHRMIHVLPDRQDPKILKGQSVYLVAGISRPESFLASAVALGASVVGTRFLPDHHPYSQSDWHQITSEAKSLNASCILTTGKDYPKLKEFEPSAMRLLALEAEAAPAETGSDVFREQLVTMLANARRRLSLES